VYVCVCVCVSVCVCICIVIMKTTVFDSYNYEILLIISEHGTEVSLQQYDIFLRHVFPNFMSETTVSIISCLELSCN
jgi:hypothetical protein